MMLHVWSCKWSNVWFICTAFQHKFGKYTILTTMTDITNLSWYIFLTEIKSSSLILSNTAIVGSDLVLAYRLKKKERKLLAICLFVVVFCFIFILSEWVYSK